MAAIPMAKVVSLLIRTLAKPIATKLKKEAGVHPFLSNSSQFIGQQIHSITSRINVTTAGFKFLGVKPLPKEEALSKGINFLSDLFIFSVAVTVVVVENVRADHSGAIKKEKEAKALKIIEDILENRFANIEKSLQEIEESLPTSSTWHLQKIRKLKAEMKIEAELNEKKNEETRLALATEKKRAERRRAVSEGQTNTPRAKRVLKAKKEPQEERLAGSGEHAVLSGAGAGAGAGALSALSVTLSSTQITSSSGHESTDKSAQSHDQNVDGS